MPRGHHTKKERTQQDRFAFESGGFVYRSLFDAHWIMKFVSEGCPPLTDDGSAQLVGNRGFIIDLIVEKDRWDVKWRFIQWELT